MLSASSALDFRIAWYANDGTGSFGPQQIISTFVEHATAVVAADLDGDGDQDVVSTSADDDKVAWYENLGGTNSVSDISATPGPFIFPNPLVDRAIVTQVALAGPVTAEVLDMHGRLLRTEGGFATNGRYVVERDGLPAGAYVLRLRYGQEQRAMPFMVR